MKPVIVYGANGRTGRRIATALVAHCLPVIVAGRDGSVIAELARTLGVEGRASGLNERRGLAKMLAGASALVNCAGPFVETARALAGACVESKVDYLDISAERIAVQSLLDLHEDARRAGVRVIPAAGANGALGVWARVMANEYSETPLREVDVSYAHGTASFLRATPGAIQSFAREVFHMVAPENGGYHFIPRRVFFPPPYGLGHAIQTRGPDDVALPNEEFPAKVRSWLAADPGTMINFIWSRLHEPSFSRGIAPTAIAMLREVAFADRRELAKILPPPEDDGLAVVIESNGPRLSISTENRHEATVHIVELCVRALGNASARGVISPATLVRSRDALRELTRNGVIRVFRDDRTRRYR